MENRGEILIYKNKDKETQIEVRLEEETVWLNQTQIIDLFKRDQSVVSRHINNVFKEGELDKESNMHFLHIANPDKPVAFYSQVLLSIVFSKYKFL